MKQYRACKCTKPGHCKRYNKIMSPELWQLCQTSERHRMLFDEQAGNFNFGMIHRRGETTFHQEIAKMYKEKRKAGGTNPMSTIGNAQKAIDELKKQGIDVRDLDQGKEKGLGDTIERILTSFGLTKEVMSKLAGKTCGCSGRKTWLNKLLPYTKE